MLDTNTTVQKDGSASSSYGRTMRFGVLGPLEVTEGEDTLSVGGPKQRAVLALLIADAGSPVTTDALVQGVYGDDADAGVRRSVQTFVSNLRSSLGDVIQSTGNGYVLRVDRQDIDAARFQDAVVAATQLDDPEARAMRLREALALWRGHAYADIDGLGRIAAETTRLNEARGAAIEARIDADLDLGRHRELVAELQSLTEEYPLREGLRAQQMLALYRSGRQAEALRAYDRTRTYLVEELGLDPSPELRDLEQRILDQDASLRFDGPRAVRTAAVLVADVAEPSTLSELTPGERDAVIDDQSDAIGEAARSHGGTIFANRGSAVYLSFATTESAVAAATEIQSDLHARARSMRMGVSSGDVELAVDGTVSGPPVTRAVQLTAIAHAGQVLMSPEANQALADTGAVGWTVRSLGVYQFDKSVETGRAVYQLVLPGLPTDFPPLRVDAMPLAVPENPTGLPGYELREPVGAGAFGVVHRAYQPTVGRQVAIKIVRPEYANDPQFIRRFEIEAQLVARLEHPSIVPLYDYWRNPDGAYLVMRWLGGGSLKDRLATSGPLSLDEVDALVSQVGVALAFAHERGVAHRDIKASNVMLDEEGRSYLGDFGVAYRTPQLESIAADIADFSTLIASCLDPATHDREIAAIEAAGTSDSMIAFLDACASVLGPETGVVEAVQEYTESRNPYKGLQAFGEGDAADFHGRDAAVLDILDSLAGGAVVAVVGPSGIGKSSVVRAGVLPALRSGAIAGSARWLITDMIPGTHPFEELATCLLRVADSVPQDIEAELSADERGLVRVVRRHLPEGLPVVVVVDQFEELFTLASADDRNAFLAMMAAAASDERSDVRFVVTVRADYFDRPLRFAELGDLLRDGTIPIAAPDRDALNEMITQPAAGVGVTFESGLVERITSEVEGQPGALPLLEFALTELFDRRTSNTLTSAIYEEIGGVLGALATRAEQTHASLDAAEQEAAREAFLRMVIISDGARSTRRRVRVSELERLALGPNALEAAIGAFASHRLLTFDRDPVTHGPTVEIAHEALLREWGRYAEWIDDHREDLLLRSRLIESAREWEDSGRDSALLLSAGRLAQHEAWTAHTDLALEESERELIADSRLAIDEAASGRRRRRRAIMVGFGAAALVASVFAIGALVANSEAQRQRDEAANQALIAEENAAASEASEERARESQTQAEEQARVAEEQARTARAQQLVASAAATIDEDPQLAALLAVVGWKDLPEDPGALAILRESTDANRTLLSYPWPIDGLIHGDMSSDGELAIIGGTNSALTHLVDVETGEPLWTFEPVTERSSELIASAQFVQDDTVVAVSIAWGGSVDPEVTPPPGMMVYLVDVDTGDVLETFDAGCSGGVIANSSAPEDHLDIDVVSAEWAEAEGCIYDANGDWGAIDVARLDTRNGESTVVLGGMNAARARWSVGLRSDGVTAAVGVEDLRVEVIEVDTGRVLLELPPDVPAQALAVSPDGRLMAHGGVNGPGGRPLWIREVQSGEILATASGHAGGVATITFTDDSQLLVTGGEDGAVRMWDVETGRQVDEFIGGGATISDLSVSRDGSRIAAFSWDGTLRVFARSAEDFAGVETTSLCDQAFYTTAGLTVRSDRLLSFVVCDVPSGGEPSVFLVDMAADEILYVFDDFVGQNQDLHPDGAIVGGQIEINDEESGEALGGPIRVVNADTGDATSLPGLCVYSYDTFDGPDCGDPPDDYAAYAWDVDFSNDGSMIGFSRWFGPAGQVWDLATGDSLATFPGDSLEFAPDDSLMAAAEFDEGTLSLFDTTSWQPVSTISIEGDFGLNMHRFHPDGQTMVSAVFAGWGAGDIIYHAIPDLAEIRRISAPHEAGIRDLDISSDGSMFATAGQAGFVKLWDYETGELIDSILVERDNRVQSVVFIRNDTFLMVTTPEGPIRYVPLDAEAVFDQAAARLTRGFTEFECASYFPDGSCPTLDEIRSR